MLVVPGTLSLLLLIPRARKIVSTIGFLFFFCGGFATSFLVPLQRLQQATSAGVPGVGFKGTAHDAAVHISWIHMSHMHMHMHI